MIKIYLSPSNQPYNKYCVGDTNEKTQMEALAQKIKDILDTEYECETVMATLSMA
jgi:N-acetylmuramoyl-L-alanine amidase